MTAKTFVQFIDGENMRASACGGSCLDAYEIWQYAYNDGLKELASKINKDGSPWEAYCVVKEAAELEDKK